MPYDYIVAPFGADVNTFLRFFQKFFTGWDEHRRGVIHCGRRVIDFARFP